MFVKYLHKFDVSVQEALAIQMDLAKQIAQIELSKKPKLIAGLDVSINKNKEATAAAVVLNYPEFNILEIAISAGTVTFPYVPGLLSFREMPLTIDVCAKLKSRPDLFIVDGQGLTHPRKMGLASHLGLFLDTPTIGCAKSPLFGKYNDPGFQSENYNLIYNDYGETIGAVLRTKYGIKPLYISVGHNITLSESIKWILNCCKGYRLPEPTRLAHLASKGNL
jgi:deoxyribonuclease V